MVRICMGWGGVDERRVGCYEWMFHGLMEGEALINVRNQDLRAEEIFRFTTPIRKLMCKGESPSNVVHQLIHRHLAISPA